MEFIRSHPGRHHHRLPQSDRDPGGDRSGDGPARPAPADRKAAGRARAPARRARFDTVIDTIYDVAADPSSWEAAIRATADLVSAGSGVLFGQSVRGGQVFWAYETRADPTCLRVYAEHHMQNPWSLHMEGRALGDVVFSDEAIRTSDLLRSGFWHDVLRPQDINHNAMVALARHGAFTAAFNLCRTPRQGPYDERQRAMLRRLVPHLQRACQLQMRLDGYQALRHRLPLGQLSAGRAGASRAEASDGWDAKDRLRNLLDDRTQDGSSLTSVLTCRYDTPVRKTCKK